MFALRQALSRGVDSLAIAREAAGPVGPRPSRVEGARPDTLAFVVAVLSELAARGIPKAAAVADAAAASLRARDATTRAAREGTLEAAAPLTPGEIDQILGVQEPDGSWQAIPECLAHGRGEHEGGTPGSDAVGATARCLWALAGALPRLSPRADLERAYWADGYFILENFLAPADVEALLRAHRHVHGALDVGFYTSWFQPTDARVFTDREVRAAVAARLKALFPAHRMIFGTFMSKGCEGETAFPLHQDPSFVDERTWSPVTFWVPLIDVDEANGCIHVVPGSHLLSADPRLPYKAFPYPEFAERLERCLRPIPMHAGDLLLFHPGLMHASPSNVSGRLRVAAAGALVPEPAQVFVYRSAARDDGITEVFAVDDAYYVGIGGDDVLAESNRVAELRVPPRSSVIDRMLSDIAAEAPGGNVPRPSEPSSLAGRPLHDSPGAHPAEAAEPGAPAPADGEARPRSEVEIAFRETLSGAVSRATVATWELLDVERTGGLLTLKVRTPFGEVVLDVRSAVEGGKSFKTVDGIAYSYRRLDRDLPEGAVGRLNALITHLHAHTATLELV